MDYSNDYLSDARNREIVRQFLECISHMPPDTVKRRLFALIAQNQTTFAADVLNSFVILAKCKTSVD